MIRLQLHRSPRYAFNHMLLGPASSVEVTMTMRRQRVYRDGNEPGARLVRRRSHFSFHLVVRDSARVLTSLISNEAGARVNCLGRAGRVPASRR